MPSPSESLLQTGARLMPALDGAPSAAPLPASSAAPSGATCSLPERVDVAVIGAGVIGLSIAWRLAARGLGVAVFDRAAAGSGTSGAATGMLAAAAEHEPGNPDFLALALESQRLWPGFARALEAESGLSVDYRDEGTLLVALGREEVLRLRARHEYQRRHGLDTCWLGGPEVRALEPLLRPGIAAGLFAAGDHQVDPRRVVAALARAFAAAGGRLVEGCAVEAIETEGGRVAGVRTTAGVCRAGTVVVASGPWAVEAGLLPSDLALPLRPLKGQALALRSTPRAPLPRHVVWTEQVHLAPKGDGRLIVGATMEEAGFDASITAGGVYALLEGVRRALPSAEEMEVEAIWSGFRPTSDDDAPILGAVGPDGLVLAVGHHRNGILLAPVTAEAVADQVTAGQIAGAAARFGLDRFGPPPATEETGETRRQRTGT